MRSGNLPRKFLVQLFLLVLCVSHIDAGNFDFYQDVDPERPMDANYEELARYLEAEKSGERGEVNGEGVSPNVPWPYIEYLYYRRQKEKNILEALLENPSVLDALETRKAKERAILPQFHYDVFKDLNRINPEETRPYMSLDSIADNSNENTNFQVPYAKGIFRNEKPRYAQSLSSYPLRINSGPLNRDDYPLEKMNAERLMKLEGKLLGINENHGNIDDVKSQRIPERKPPEFTYKFDEPRTEERDAFAIRPNDPRYYQPDETSTDSATIDEKVVTNRDRTVAPLRKSIDEDEGRQENMPKTEPAPSTENTRNDKFSIMKIVLPEPHRRAEPDSVVVSSSRIMSNDIYFIAIVAGCSAAAMFALVLISLTWCRLNRGAKAAADIEYPAYGVTGPNKDISPSGDQRLAHSAQMYHFQHQKQQIIAMENRTAASRDPGSVSEAESDEENEEGDYTVYECPGLASTGEMEVKNPMFRDDPTPATPPKIHKEEDHI